MHFTTEEAVDTGGPTREFFRLFVNDVCKCYCIGEAGKCLFMKNVPALQVCIIKGAYATFMFPLIE